MNAQGLQSSCDSQHAISAGCKKLEKVCNLLEKATTNAVCASARLIGRGDEVLLDKAATDAMRDTLAKSDIKVRVAIGEGERDKAPMLYSGEILGGKVQNNAKKPNAEGSHIDITSETSNEYDIEYDLAIDPLEGTGITSRGLEGSMCVIAASKPGDIKIMPDTYMMKLAYPKFIPDGVLSLEKPASENLKALAQFFNVQTSDISLTMLDRPRHKNIIQELRKLNPMIKLIQDGDILAALEVVELEKKCNLYYGIGGAPEGVIAASALQAHGDGIIQTQIVDDEMNQVGGILHTQDLVGRSPIFVATGLTGNWFVEAAEEIQDGIYSCTTVVMAENISRRTTQIVALNK